MLRVGQPFNVLEIEFIDNTKFAFFIGRNFFKVDRTLIQGRCIRLQLMPSAKVWTCICAWSFAHNGAYLVKINFESHIYVISQDILEFVGCIGDDQNKVKRPLYQGFANW